MSLAHTLSTGAALLGSAGRKGRSAPRREPAVASTPMAPAVPARVYVPIGELSRVTDLSTAELIARFPSHWGVPGNWKMERSVVLVAKGSLSELEQELSTAGQSKAAHKLAAWLGRETQWWRKGQYE